MTMITMVCARLLRRTGSDDRAGFAVPVVVFMLASVMLLMATGYELIRVVGDVRSSGRDGLLAEKNGQAAVERFMGDQLGTPPDSQIVQLAEYTRIKLRARRMGRTAGFRTTYLMTGEAEEGPHSPAKRTVRAFAVLEPPVEAVAVVSNLAGTLTVTNGATVNGNDLATNGACVEPAGNIGGAYAVGSITTTGGNPISGNPQQQTAGSRTAATTRLAIRWETLLGPEVPVQYSSPSAWPNFASMPTDTFPVIRIQGDFTPASTHSGRGALIVTGTFRPGSNFSWNGVILAGMTVSTATPTWTLRGLLVTGMDPNAGAMTIPAGPNLQYNRCYVMRAFEKLSHLEPVLGSKWTER
jgi:hypothetical protein